MTSKYAMDDMRDPEIASAMRAEESDKTDSDRLTKASENLRIQFQRADEPYNDMKDLMRAIHEFWDAKAEATNKLEVEACKR